MKKKITTLAELQAEKEIVKGTLEMTRQEFLKSLELNRSQTKEFLFKKVALPAGIVGATYGGLKAMSSSSENRSVNAGVSFISKMIPLAIQAFSVYFLKQKVEEVTPETAPIKRNPQRPANLSADEIPVSKPNIHQPISPYGKTQPEKILT